MALNLSSILRISAFQESFSVLQQQEGAYVGGIFVNATPVTINLFGSVQPLAARDRLDLPEGERVAEGIVAYVKNNVDIESIRVGTNATNGDVLIWHETNYLIKSVKNWQEYGHYRIMATRLEGQTG